MRHYSLPKLGKQNSEVVIFYKKVGVDLMYWYVLFVKPGQELKVENFLKRTLDWDVFSQFIPMSSTLFKAFGKIKKEIKPMFLSYVFIEADIKSFKFILEMKSIINQSNGIIRILKYDNTNEIASKNDEGELLSKFLNNDNYFVATKFSVLISHYMGYVQGQKEMWQLFSIFRLK